jgi:hypothetical protein
MANLAVMRDPSVPLSTRIDAAAQVLKLDYQSGTYFPDRPHWPGEREVIIRIGGLPRVVQHDFTVKSSHDPINGSDKLDDKFPF